ncbi:MAG: glycosyltransferase [Methylacidiphilales bacterium]|nr:glycosyltransferase [Candidatus Methylacidiphilales bacterium]
MNSRRSFVFWDPSGRRWPRWKRRAFTVSVLLIAGLVLFIRSMLSTPALRVPKEVERMKADLRAYSPPAAPGENQATKPIWLGFQRKLLGHRIPALPLKPVPDLRPLETVHLGFVAEWDPNSFESLKTHGENLTHVCVESLNLSDLEGNLDCDPPGEVREWTRSKRIPLLLMLQNIRGSEWQPERVESLAMGPPERRNHFITGLLTALESTGCDGIVVDWQEVDPGYKNGLTVLFTQMAQALHAQNKELWICIPVGNDLATYDLDALSSHADRFIAVLHDENSERDQPGPIASEDWFEGWLKTLTSYGQLEQWVIAVGNYGYDWQEDRAGAQTLSFADVMVRASHSGVTNITSSAPAFNPHFHYEIGNEKHTVWFLDAVTALNQLRAAADFGIGGFAIYRLGLEDPDIWTSLQACKLPKLTASQQEELASLQLENRVGHVGRGELIQVEEPGHAGERILTESQRGLLATQYKQLPVPWTVYHQGGDKPDDVTLTFDDGPDPKWTPKVLDILKEEKVHAVFFLVGRQAERYPDLVRRIVTEGHEIGSHTFFHPDLSEAYPEQVRLELNSTQRLLQAITGHSTILFRPPYIADSKPSRVSELRPLLLAQELGYIILAQEIDPRDYEKPGVHEILKRVQEQRPLGNVLLMHDGGGNRQQTVEALPQVIQYLRERGDHIVSASELLDIPRDELMPPAPAENSSLDQMASGWGFFSIRYLEECLWALMIFGTLLVLIRTVTVVILASRQKLDQSADWLDSPFHPPVSVVIAAYNEAKVIKNTIRSILENSYPGLLELVIVDDGSSDNTSQVIESAYAGRQNLQVMRQENSGKAGALTHGLRAAKYDILVFVDADTQLANGAIQLLIQPLEQPAVGAVSGQARVGNNTRWLGRCQWLEYICGFNLDRRAYALLDAITVVPGAIGAYRREAIEKVGGFTHDTLAEDTDLTLSLHRAGYQVAYAGNAIAHTEAPESIRSLFKQRFRWAFGTMQCLWKHRDMLFNPRYRWLGFFSLPSIWIFQIILVAFMPLADLLAVIALVQGAAPVVWIYIGVFMFTDLFLAALACSFEGMPIGQSWPILPMRLLYRPLLSLVVWKSILTAVRGVLVGWGKIERTASPMPPL